MGERAARVEVTLPDEPAIARVDAPQVERALVNLIENALKYSPADEPVRVLVAVHGSYGVVRVIDHGPGIAGDEADRIFEPFHRGRSAGSVRGAGLGLAIARGFAEASGGRVWVESRDGQGATFTLELPLAEAVLVTGPRILVVDDEQQILRALRTSLRAAGYEVETADTAEGALAAAAMRPPEAVILDLVLPDGSGIDVCRELRTWSSAPVIVLSAVGDEAEKVAALDAGADDYVTKPVGIDELLARLRAALRRAGPPGEPVIAVGELEVDLEQS